MTTNDTNNNVISRAYQDLALETNNKEVAVEALAIAIAFEVNTRLADSTVRVYDTLKFKIITVVLLIVGNWKLVVTMLVALTSMYLGRCIM
mmetsp:Transcript_1042/g.1887  ORF Transcript_1042/g.1887 Transcript_1042/m.1887 type:complete len:91 (-) Transcript_1042:216-488(-)